jgi:hypothetical protein
MLIGILVRGMWAAGLCLFVVGGCGCVLDTDGGGTQEADDSTSGGNPTDLESICASAASAEACAGTQLDADAGDGYQCIWRNVVTSASVQPEGACEVVDDEMRCILGAYAGAGCSPNCGGPLYGGAFGRVLPDGRQEVVTSCEIVPAGTFVSCGSAELPTCACGCESECVDPYC